MAKQNLLDNPPPPPPAAVTDTRPNIVNSPSGFSCHSHQLFIEEKNGHNGNNSEKLSIRSEGLDSVSEQRRAPSNLTKIRKVSAVSVLIFTKISLEIR